jgi:hypothetical protein
MDGIEDKYFMCDCHNEGMLVTKWEGDEQVCFSYWKLGKSPRKLKFWSRLKWSLKMLFKGDIFEDQITLDEARTKQLSRYLNKITN